MGAFFTNVQVRAAARSGDDARRWVVAELRTWLAEQGFVELTGDDINAGAVAERGILVGPATADGWISVYDEACEDQDGRKIDALAERLSSGGGVAVGVLDHDSDILKLWLYENGQFVDTFDSNPNYFAGAGPADAAELSQAELEQVRGHADRWRHLLVPGATAEQLEQEWRRKHVFAEEMLAPLARLFGWDESLSAVGFNYLDRGHPAFDQERFTRLNFQAPGNPLASLGGTGLPEFDRMGGQSQLRTEPGKRFENVGVTFMSTGGAGTGLEVVLWGPGLELLDMREIGLVLRSDWSALPAIRMVPLERVTSPDGDPVAVAEIPDFEIPPGVIGGSNLGLLLQLGMQGVSMRRTLEAQTAAIVGFVLSGSGARVGQGELYVGVAPLENQEDGRSAWTLNVVVSEG